MLRDLAISSDLSERVLVVMKRVCDKGWTISTAESCTGGLVAALLTDIEGCSHAFDRGFVTYTDDAKVDLLGVDAVLLENNGAVSHEVAVAMAEGALRHSSSDIALSVTGYAGPTDTGGHEGLVYFSLAQRNRPTCHQMQDFGPRGRDEIRHSSLLTLLGMLETAMQISTD